MKKLISFLFFCTFFLPMFAQVPYLTLSGHVTDLLNNNPVINHEVTIQTDSSTVGFSYYNSVLTDNNGFYVDTIHFNTGFIPTGVLLVSTLDCNQAVNTASLSFGPGNLSFVLDFQICSTAEPCNADFTSSPDSLNELLVHFTDLSTGNINSWLWNFGDGSSSTQQNPSHQYSQAGNYGISLQVQGTDSSCNSINWDTVTVGNTTGCQAHFSWYIDSLNAGNTVHFIDLSTGSGLNWYWTFGDSTTSDLQNPVHTYQQPGTYNVCLTITSNNPACTSTWCTQVVVGNTAGCESYFTFMANWLDLSFEAYKPNGRPATFTWSFGDGLGGSGQNVTHTYAAPGYYTVTMTSLEDSTLCTFSTSQTILVGDSTNIHQVYGQVFEGSFPVDQGLVMIFSVDTSANSQPYFAQTDIDSTGVYIFPYVPDGEYVIWAMPTDSAGGYLPTFFGDVIFWEQATVITLGNPQNLPYDIHLVPASSFASGPGGINGQINSTGLKSTSVDKITMLLMNEQSQAIDYRRVNTGGSFDFSTLGYGTYYLRAELPNYTSDVVKVVISAANPFASVTMTFTDNGILGVSNHFETTESIIIFPNPVKDVVKISLKISSEVTVSVTVYNLRGQPVTGGSFSLARGENKITLDLSNLSPGMYTLQITSGKGINQTRKLIVTR